MTDLTATPTSTLHVTPAGEGEHALLGADIVTIKAPGKATGGKLLVLEVTVPPGGGPPMLHRHEYTEMFYVLSGEFIVNTLMNGSGKMHTLHEGDTIAIPSMAWHTFKNAGKTPGKLLVVHNSAVMEGLLDELGVPLADPTNPPPAAPPSAREVKKFMATVTKYMELLPPGVGMGEGRV